MLKSWKPSPLHILLVIIVAQLGTTCASQNLSSKGLSTHTLSRSMASTSSHSGRKRKKRRKSEGGSGAGVYNNAFNNLETKRTTASAEDAAVAPSESTKGAVERKQPEEKMPSLFMRPDELIYDKYAACLAATEGLRRTRDATIDRNRSAVGISARPVKSIVQFWRRGEEDTSKGSKEKYQRACAQYTLHSGKLVRSMGLSVSQFNQLGREVGSDNVLKERVLEQAYLYRMAATVNMGKIPLIEDPNSKQLLKSHRRRRLQMFVQSITEIEDLRAEQTKRLQNALNIDVLPPTIKISDPALLPILDPRVRAVVEAFPLQAEEIVKKYGLKSDEFNQMLEENRTNPVFRRRVKNYMQKHDALVRDFDECKIPDNP